MNTGRGFRSVLVALFGAILLALGLALNAQTADAQGEYREFIGAVIGEDGWPADDGIQVTAIMGGSEVGTAYVQGGLYNMLIPMVGTDENSEVIFVINGRRAGTYLARAPLEEGVMPPAIGADLSIAIPPTPRPRPTATPQPTARPAATAVPAATPIPQPTAVPTPTNTPANPLDSLRGQVEGFEVPPEVGLRPTNDVINSDEDGVIEATMFNSGLNRVNLLVELTLAVPSGIHISSSDGSFNSGAGRGTTKYIVEPGQRRNITFYVQADKVGKFTVTSSSKYWPEGRESLWNPITLSHPFTVEQATGRSRARNTTSSQPPAAPATGSNGGNGGGPGASGGCTIGASGVGGGTAAVGGVDLSMAAMAVLLISGMGLVWGRARTRRQDAVG